jgi:hypothetical protein
MKKYLLNIDNIFKYIVTEKQLNHIKKGFRRKQMLSFTDGMIDLKKVKHISWELKDE